MGQRLPLDRHVVKRRVRRRHRARTRCILRQPSTPCGQDRPSQRAHRDASRRLSARTLRHQMPSHCDQSTSRLALKPFCLRRGRAAQLLAQDSLGRTRPRTASVRRARCIVGLVTKPPMPSRPRGPAKDRIQHTPLATPFSDSPDERRRSSGGGGTESVREVRLASKCQSRVHVRVNPRSAQTPVGRPDYPSTGRCSGGRRSAAAAFANPSASLRALIRAFRRFSHAPGYFVCRGRGRGRHGVARRSKCSSGSANARTEGQAIARRAWTDRTAILRRLSEKNRDVHVIDVTRDHDVARALGILATPTLVEVEAGRIVQIYVGQVPSQLIERYAQ